MTYELQIAQEAHSKTLIRISHSFTVELNTNIADSCAIISCLVVVCVLSTKRRVGSCLSPLSTAT